MRAAGKPYRFTRTPRSQRLPRRPPIEWRRPEQGREPTTRVSQESGDPVANRHALSFTARFRGRARSRGDGTGALPLLETIRKYVNDRAVFIR
jgi:hypothetical protein